MTIPFPATRVTVNPNDIPAIKGALDAPEILQLRDEPTAVFVVLGYADPGNDAKKQLAVSQQRADAVVAVMRDKCGVLNVAHAVAMGGAKLTDAKNLEKSRVVEVWAVKP